jgi:pimeloyl-ACP methyl ester carboxylesterase
LVVVNPVGLHLPDGPIADIFGRSPGELARDLFADHDNEVAQAMIGMDHVRNDLATADEVPFELFRVLAQTMAATARLGWDPYLHNPKLRGRLGRIRCPTLVVRGGADTLVPAVHAETYAAEVPGARLHVLAGAGHLAQLERPDELAAIVRDVLDPAR